MAADNASGEGLPEALTRWRAPIHRYILGIVRDAPAAEDATQETFLRAHARASSLQDPSKLVAWLFRIATNVCHDHFRAGSWRHRPESLDAENQDEGPALDQLPADEETRLDKVMEQQEMSACVQQYLLDLPDPYRAALLLHDVEGLTNPEIAEMLGISLATVKIRLHRARTRLRAALDQACSFSQDDRGVLVCEPKPKLINIKP